MLRIQSVGVNKRKKFESFPLLSTVYEIIVTQFSIVALFFAKASLSLHIHDKVSRILATRILHENYNLKTKIE